jgi:hypothetical protein
MSSNIDKLIKNLGSSGTSSGIDFKKYIPLGSSRYNWKLILKNTLIVLFVLFIILILIHFLVTPIFKLKMGGKGFISLPVKSEGYILWDNNQSDTLLVSGTPLESISNNYTISMDVNIEKPNDITNKYRLLFARVVNSSYISAEDPQTIQEQLGDFNLAIYSEKGTNDIYVTIMDTSHSIKTVVIKNTPVREPFRLVTVIADTYMDVYMNGYLSGSTTFDKPPYSPANNLIGPSSTSIRVKKLIIFNRALNPAEAKDIQPSISKFDMNTSIAESSTCTSLSSANVPPY